MLYRFDPLEREFGGKSSRRGSPLQRESAGTCSTTNSTKNTSNPPLPPGARKRIEASQDAAGHLEGDISPRDFPLPTPEAPDLRGQAQAGEPGLDPPPPRQQRPIAASAAVGAQRRRLDGSWEEVSAGPDAPVPVTSHLAGLALA